MFIRLLRFKELEGQYYFQFKISSNIRTFRKEVFHNLKLSYKQRTVGQAAAIVDVNTTEQGRM